MASAAAAGRASFGRPPWAWSKPGLPAWSWCWPWAALGLLLGSTSWPVFARGEHRKRPFVRGAQRPGVTKGSNDPARTASTVARCATLSSPLCQPTPRRAENGGSIGSYVLRAFDDTRDLKSSRRRRNPALNGVSPTHNTYPWNYPRYVYEFNLQKRERGEGRDGEGRRTGKGRAGGVGRMGKGTEGGDLEVSQARDKLRSGAHNNAQPPKALSTLTLTLHDRSVHAAPSNICQVSRAESKNKPIPPPRPD